MKVNFSKITAADRTLLAEFYESANYKAFKKHFIENGQLTIAQSALFATEQERLQCQGKVVVLKEIDEHLKEIHKKANQ